MVYSSSSIFPQHNAVAKKWNQTKYTASVDKDSKPRKSSIYHFPVAILSTNHNSHGKNTSPKVHAHDILCGRGGHANKHPGNIAFRALVEQNQELYVRCNKIGKILVSKSIVEAIYQQSPPGRFLVLDNKIKMWKEVEYKVAMKKTSQAIRDVLSKQQTNNTASVLSTTAWKDLVQHDLPAYVTTRTTRKNTDTSSTSSCHHHEQVQQINSNYNSYNNEQVQQINNNYYNSNSHYNNIEQVEEDHEPLPLDHDIRYSYQEQVPTHVIASQETVHVTPPPTEFPFNFEDPEFEEILSSEVSDEEISLLENEGIVDKPVFMSRECASV